MGKVGSEDTYKASNSKVSGITPIAKDVVHKICSGQVVLTLAVAVKELLENSLDAGATAIDIRLIDQGSTLVEVADNGSGIKEDDFEGIALKHHTSKLSSFSDLESVGTFGFRGEALSSLCSLCGKLSVLTCHSSANCATSLEFDSKGILVKKMPCARQVGTTVSLHSLFSGLPVRRKEFLRHLQREFVKMTHLLYAYCLVSTGVRITCTNRNQQKGIHNGVVVATQGGETVRDNIACVFGQKQLMTLIDFKQKEAPDEILEEFGLKPKRPDDDFTKQEECDNTLEEDEVEEIIVKSSPYNITGCMSTCAHGKGRAAPDRQFFFINARPCEPTKVIRLINDVYHQYNCHQNPFIFMDIRTDGAEGCGVDVNVTPDKRKIFIENEKLLLATIKASLVEMYASTPRTFLLQNLPNSFMGNRTTSSIKSENEQKTDGSAPSSLHGSSSSTSLQLPKSSSSAPSVAMRISQVLSRFAQSSSIPIQNENPAHVSKRKSDSDFGAKNKQPKLDQFCSPKSKNSQTLESDQIDRLESTKVTNFCSSEVLDVQEQNGAEIDPYSMEHRENEDKTEENAAAQISILEHSEKEMSIKHDEEAVLASKCEIESFELRDDSHDLFNTSDATEDTKSNNKPLEMDYIIGGSETACKNSIAQKIVRNVSYKPDEKVEDCSLEEGGIENNEKSSIEVYERDMGEELEIVILDDDQESNQGEKKVIDFDVSLDDIVTKTQKVMERKKKRDLKLELERKGRFNAGITPKENMNAETELQREITKEMFSKMKIIGQFNFGFIVTQLGSDLFIVDQHASDEKYNFETLQLTDNLQQQPLVVPQPLDLTAAAKAVLTENIEVFQRNGFRFSFPSDDETGDGRVCLTSIPYSRNYTFGKEDIDELIFMLQDSPHTNCRPSRVRDMFASRACRKSVMIGTALSVTDMRRLIDHMGLIEQPWNCPHGRPTMRHLINLDLILSG